jgi:hypothetical protein
MLSNVLMIKFGADVVVAIFGLLVTVSMGFVVVFLVDVVFSAITLKEFTIKTIKINFSFIAAFFFAQVLFLIAIIHCFLTFFNFLRYFSSSRDLKS